MSGPSKRARVALLGTTPVATLGLLAWLAVAGSLLGCGGSRFTGCEASRTCPGAGGSPDAVAAGNVGGAAGASAGSGEAGAPQSDTGPCDGKCAKEQCCDQQCVDLTVDPLHCGACGQRCAPDDAQASCADSQCVAGLCQEPPVCNDKGACEQTDLERPETPMPLSPLLGAFTGSLHAREVVPSLKPRFQWSEVETAGCGRISYHMQLDRNCSVDAFQHCAFETPEVDAQGLEQATFSPAEDLPVERSNLPLGSRYYWRVRACTGSGDAGVERCSDWSEVHYLDVGRLKADVTGDGFADVVAVEFVTTIKSRITLYAGGVDFGEALDGGSAELTPTHDFSQPVWAGGEHNSAKVRLLGDVNGDGYNDFGVPGLPPSVSGADTQSFWIYLGGRAPADFQPVELTMLLDADPVQPGVYSAGDFNGDGFADFVLSVSGSISRPLFVGGGPGPLAESRPLQLNAPFGFSEVRYGETWAAGDFNADGRPDLIATHSADAVLHVFDGSSLNDFDYDRQVDFLDCSNVRLTPIDVRADGRDDLVVSCVSGAPDSVMLLVNEADGWSTLTGALPYPALEFAAGDLDGNGIDDLIAGGPVVFSGSELPRLAMVEAGIAEPTDQWQTPVALADHNGDGVIDVVVGGVWYRGEASFFPGHSAALIRDGEAFHPTALAR